MIASGRWYLTHGLASYSARFFFFPTTEHCSYDARERQQKAQREVLSKESGTSFEAFAWPSKLNCFARRGAVRRSPPSALSLVNARLRIVSYSSQRLDWT